jgi:hypothetical protein
LVEKVMRQHGNVTGPGLDAILEADRWARIRAAERVAAGFGCNSAKSC